MQEVALRGIKFYNENEYKILDDIEFYFNLFDIPNINHNSLFCINMIHTCGVDYTGFPLMDNIIDEINEQKNIKCLIFILNETCYSDKKDFEEVSRRTNLPYFITNYDVSRIDDKNHIFYPASMTVQLEQLTLSHFDDALHYLFYMNNQFSDLQKPYRCSFYSAHINPIRIDIFNLLKKHDVLKESTWSFHKSEEYYSGYKHDLDAFYKENEGLIPHSFDYFSADKVSLKHTYFSQWLCYFEILTESYFFTEMPKGNTYSPMTEKILKPIVSCLPFIIFCPTNLKSGLEKMGMTFDSPLYGFYDISDDEQVKLGMEHIERQITISKEELHETYFQYVNEYQQNLEIFMKFFKEYFNEITHRLNQQTK